jgi:hypothetical protein
MRKVIGLGIALAFAAGVALADVQSGPKPGDKVAELKVFAVSGDVENKEADYTAERKDKPTVYVFVRADAWSRPMARFLKKLDAAVPEAAEGAYVVAVWLSEKPDDSKDYLPKAQQSLKFEKTALTVFPGEASGPKGWGVNPDAHLTAVVAVGGKVAASLAYMSVNETDATGVTDALKKAAKK